MRNLEEDLAQFAEAELKCTSIGHNAFAKHHRDKIEVITKDLRYLIAFFTVWRDLQKYWAYLLPIFEQKDIALQMKESFDIFNKIDKSYRDEVARAK